MLKSTDGVRSQLANVKRAISTSAKRFCGDEQHVRHAYVIYICYVYVDRFSRYYLALLQCYSMLSRVIY